MMDSATTPDAAITATSYATLGRNQAAFWAGQANTAKTNGTDNVSLGFKDFVDLVNPLQHLPIIRNIYQAATGDTDMKPSVKLVGDSIYGGPLGMISSGADAIIKQASGKDMLETVVGWFHHDATDSATAVAAAGQNGHVTASTNNDTTAASEDLKLADIQWNQPTTVLNNPPANFGFAAAKPLGTAPASPPNDTAVPIAAAAQPSQFFAGLRKNTANGSTMPIPIQHVHFDPMAQKFAGIQKASYQPSMPNIPPLPSAAPDAGVMADINNSAMPISTTPNSQNDFAQKMMAAMDRYEAAKKSGNVIVPQTPMVNTGL